MKLIKSMYVSLSIAFLCMCISFLSAFIVGVDLLPNTFSGNNYYGVVIYYYIVSIPIIIFMPYLCFERIIDLKGSSGAFAALGIGIFYSFLSTWGLNLYLDLMDYFPARQTFMFMVAYGFNEFMISFLGLLLSTNFILIHFYSDTPNNRKQ